MVFFFCIPRFSFTLLNPNPVNGGGDESVTAATLNPPPSSTLNYLFVQIRFLLVRSHPNVIEPIELGLMAQFLWFVFCFFSLFLFQPGWVS